MRRHGGSYFELTNPTTLFAVQTLWEPFLTILTTHWWLEEQPQTGRWPCHMAGTVWGTQLTGPQAGLGGCIPWLQSSHGRRRWVVGADRWTGTRAVWRHKDCRLGGKEHCLLQEMLPHAAGYVLPVARGSQVKVGKHIKICLGPQKQLPNVQSSGQSMRVQGDLKNIRAACWGLHRVSPFKGLFFWVFFSFFFWYRSQNPKSSENQVFGLASKLIWQIILSWTDTWLFIAFTYST